MDSQLEEVVRFLLRSMGESAGPVKTEEAPGEIPVGISNRHVHLRRADLDRLFGAGYELTKMKDLSQPGQYASKEMVTIAGPKGAIEKVRILGPVRKETQIDILAGDSFKLGVSGPVRMSGKLSGTPGITIIGPKGSIQTAEGVIVAQRHIHMLPEEKQKKALKKIKKSEKLVVYDRVIEEIFG